MKAPPAAVASFRQANPWAAFFLLSHQFLPSLYFTPTFPPPIPLFLEHHRKSQEDNRVVSDGAVGYHTPHTLPPVSLLYCRLLASTLYSISFLFCHYFLPISQRQTRQCADAPTDLGEPFLPVVGEPSHHRASFPHLLDWVLLPTVPINKHLHLGCTLYLPPTATFAPYPSSFSNRHCLCRRQPAAKVSTPPAAITRDPSPLSH